MIEKLLVMVKSAGFPGSAAMIAEPQRRDLMPVSVRLEAHLIGYVDEVKLTGEIP